MQSNKFKSRLKKFLLGIIFFLLLVSLGHLITGYGYVLKGVAFAYFRGQSGPGIDESHLFYNDTINTLNSEEWEVSESISKNTLSDSSLNKLSDIETVSFLVIKNKQLIFEKYWDEFDAGHPTNLYSATKSIVSLLIGIAIDDGFISSIDQPIGDFLPEFNQGKKKNITIRHLLTMSSGLNWVESGGNPYSDNARAYYGSNLKGQIDNLKVIESPGEILKYKSGNTQILGYIVENATQLTLSGYLEKKIWSKIHPEQNALWNLDKEKGDEKAFCCLYVAPRDCAKIGQLILNKGKWGNEQIISETYLENSFVAANIKEISGEKNCRYGLHWWITNYKEQNIYYARGIYGQYIIIWPEKDMVIVRTGWSRKKVSTDGHPKDLWDYLKMAEELI